MNCFKSLLETFSLKLTQNLVVKLQNYNCDSNTKVTNIIESLQDYLMEIQRNPEKSKFCKLRLLCRSLAGNNVYYLTVTAPTDEESAKVSNHKTYELQHKFECHQLYVYRKSEQSL